MKELFLQTFVEDMQKICDGKLAKNVKYETKNQKRLKIHDEFWESLNDEQKNKYREFEFVLNEETVENEEEIYLFALKKGLLMGLEVAKSFKPQTQARQGSLKGKDCGDLVGR